MAGSGVSVTNLRLSKWGMLEKEQRGSVNLRNIDCDKQRSLENPEEIANMNCGHSCREESEHD